MSICARINLRPILIPRPTYPRHVLASGYHHRHHTTTTTTTTNRAPQGSTTEPRGEDPSSVPLTPVLLTVLATSLVFYHFYSPSGRQQPLTPTSFSPFPLASSTLLEDGQSRLLTVRIDGGRLPEGQERDGKLVLTSVAVAQPELAIQRNYTPLQPVPAAVRKGESYNLQLLVKRYSDGEVSSYLHQRKEGESVLLRGLETTWEAKEGLEEIVFIAAGTGVTPFHQLVSQLSSPTQPTKSPHVTLIQAAKSTAGLYPHLNSTLDPHNVTVHQHVSKPDTVGVLSKHWWEVWKTGQTGKEGRLQRKDLERWIGRGGGSNSQKKVILVCGPESFIRDVAGLKASDGSQGRVEGMLGELGYREDEVWKL